jgi:threonine/homoserine/homoserine lactone efflux protein
MGTMPLNPSLALGFLAMAAIMTLIPGPDTMFVLANGMMQRVRGGVMAAIGIGTGALVHTTAAALGLSALIAASQTAFTAVRWAGALYLIWLGLQAVRTAWRNRDSSQTGPAFAPVALGVVFRRAALTNIMNAKVILFYLAMLPQFVDPARGYVGLQLFVLGLMFNVLETLWLVLVGLAAGRASVWLARNTGLRRWLDASAGVLFVGLGLRLVLEGQRQG